MEIANGMKGEKFSAGEETVEVPEYLTDIEKALEQSGAEVYTPETLDAVLKDED